tara:strand:+ start:26605 stop:27156 length:552 start_codon:yes stop_codon:yes gene_type:complete
MRFKDAVVGELYRVKRAPSYQNDVTLKKDGQHASLYKGFLLECIKINSGPQWDRTTEYKVLEVPIHGSTYRKPKVGQILVVRVHTCLELADGLVLEGLSARQRKAKALERELEQGRKEIKSLRQKADDLEVSISEIETKIKALNEFESDEAELAYTLAEMFRAGGDEEKILELLLKRSKTDKL